MSFRRLQLIVNLVAFGTLFATQHACAEFAFVELVNGELSNNNALPTQVGTATVGTNVNLVTGSTNFTGSIDADIFSFIVPVGHVLDDMRLIQYAGTPVSNNMFLAISSGDKFPFDIAELNNNNPFPDVNLMLGSGAVGNVPANPNPPNPLYAHLGASVGVNMLPYLATSNDPGRQSGAGFTPPLAAGTYTVYIQETAARADYTLSFNVSAVPEPSCFGFFGVISLVAFSRRRHRCGRVH